MKLLEIVYTGKNTLDDEDFKKEDRREIINLEFFESMSQVFEFNEGKDKYFTISMQRGTEYYCREEYYKETERTLLALEDIKKTKAI